MDSIREIGENIKNSPHFKGDILLAEDLSLHTTMKVGGAAAVFAVPQDLRSVVTVLSLVRQARAPLFILGGGSNVVVGDAGLAGVVLSTAGLRHLSLEPLEEDPAPGRPGRAAVLRCGSGVAMDDVASFCAEQGLWGLSAFAGLPGTAGGAAYMNARCYETSISDVLYGVRYVETDKIPVNDTFDVAGFEKMYHNDTRDWRYKHSPFMEERVLLTEVQFLCRQSTDAERAGACAAIRAENDARVRDRTAKGHFAAPSAGSVFKNDRSFGKPSGQLIDEAGLKGVAQGGAQVAPWHGNIIINTGHATAADIQALVALVQRKVKERTGFSLEPEIVFV